MSEEAHIVYSDSYPTCVETYSTLRIFSDDLQPEDITELLHVEPTSTYRKGEAHGKRNVQYRTNGWFYSTEKLSDSKDGRRHIDIILAALNGKIDPMKSLHARGCKVDIVSYWVSVGQGGPWLMPEQMLKLGALDIEVWWDLYFEDEEET